MLILCLSYFIITVKKDVSGCNIGEHQCDSGECLDNSFICNQIVDCPNDNSDERNCPAPGEITYL